MAALLKLRWEAWNGVFGSTLGRAERSLVQARRDWRNRWAHQEPFTSDDADRALDSMARLLAAVSAPEAAEIGKMELRRLAAAATYPGGTREETRGSHEPMPFRTLVDLREGRADPPARSRYLSLVMATHDEKMFRVVREREWWFAVLMGEESQTDERTTDTLAERVQFQKPPPALSHSIRAWHPEAQSDPDGSAGLPPREGAS